MLQDVRRHLPYNPGGSLCGVDAPECNNRYQRNQETNQQSQQSHSEHKFAS